MRYEIDWLTPSQFLGTNSPPTTKVRFQGPVSNKGVRRLEMATDAHSRHVQGHVVRSSIIVSPGGPTVGAAAAPTASPNAVASTLPLQAASTPPPDQAQLPRSA